MRRKKTAGFFLCCLAALAGIVGVVAMVISSRIDTAYAYRALNQLILMGAGGVVLCLLAMWAPTKLGNHDILSTLSVIGAIALYMYVLGVMISDRVLMVAGLFSYNSQNMVGWRVFYATVVSGAGFVIASLILIISAFVSSVKEVEG